MNKEEIVEKITAAEYALARSKDVLKNEYKPHGLLSLAKAFIDEAELLLNEQPEAITEGAHLRKDDVGGCTAKNETTSLETDAGAPSSETPIVSGHKQEENSCNHIRRSFIYAVGQWYCFDCKCWFVL